MICKVTLHAFNIT